MRRECMQLIMQCECKERERVDAREVGEGREGREEGGGGLGSNGTCGLTGDSDSDSDSAYSREFSWRERDEVEGER